MPTQIQGSYKTMPGQSNTVDYGGGAKEIGPESAAYMGVDLGQFIDFNAIAAAVKAAVEKLPPGDRPSGGPDWSATIVIHPQSGTGSAFILQPNPLISWADKKLRELLGLPQSLFATA